MAGLPKHIVGAMGVTVITNASVQLGLVLFEDVVLAIFD
jgi:hypothetical protein